MRSTGELSIKVKKELMPSSPMRQKNSAGGCPELSGPESRGRAEAGEEETLTSRRNLLANA